MRSHLFTSESVSEGHPDKVADRIADEILDDHIRQDPQAKVACEVMVTSGLVFVAGEFTSHASVDVPLAVRRAIEEIGYRDPADGFDYRSCGIITSIGKQSENIARGVDLSEGSIGAGDQGLMFGYATNETPELMPWPILLAHGLVKRQSELRHKGKIPWLKPDAKSQVTVRYLSQREIVVEKVVLSAQHSDQIDNATIHEAVVEEIIKPVIPEGIRSRTMEYLINPTGRFVIGGPHGDTGVTGRKIIVDSYGGSCPHGGGAFSGKDPTKVDRSASYAARYVAKNIVAAGLSERCTVQLSYAIGRAEPTSVMLDFHGTGSVDEAALESRIQKIFDLTPSGIIEMLDLRRPIYSQTSAYGHFGRTDQAFSWERTDRVAELQR
jgi:S-adenosylmethionine synthetase